MTDTGDATQSRNDCEAALGEALAAFRDTEKHKNCAQAVMLFTARCLGTDTGAIDVARYLGGGMGRSGRICGAVTGAALSLGLRDQADPETWGDRSDEGCRQLQNLIHGFEGEFGNLDCSGLTGCDLSTEQGRVKFKNEGIRESHCVEYVRWVCGRLATLI